ncbi:MAG: hypothetical protein ABIV50_04950 [Opitutus sp.]
MHGALVGSPLAEGPALVSELPTSNVNGMAKRYLSKDSAVQPSTLRRSHVSAVNFLAALAFRIVTTSF